MSASQNDSTVFNCVEQGGKWVTVAQRGNDTAKEPLFNWQTTEFGEWNPEKRCHHVSEKLTNIVAKNGGRLNSLVITFGKVDSGETVICVIDGTQKDCDRQNLIFTLNKQNAKNPGFILNEINNFAKNNASSNPINESSAIKQYINLEDLVNSSFEKTIY